MGCVVIIIERERGHISGVKGADKYGSVMVMMKGDELYDAEYS